jgi:UDP-N-acetylmuramoyl-tripeptide--D-alanyl-D-alanine ligase
MRLHLAEVAEILGTASATPERIAQGYSIDSRQVRPGDLFFAIRGRRLDGHKYVDQALERGAVAAVVERSFKEPAADALIPVNDTTEALQSLARTVRVRWGKVVIAVTGSTGKTTTKEMIAAVLGRRFSVLKSPGNLNNDYGLPQALLALEPEHQGAVVELAMSGPREIARLARMAEPEIGVVTNVAAVHLQFFNSIEGIARAKKELIENLSWDRLMPTAVLNDDDLRVRAFAQGFEGRVLTFGLGKGAQYRASNVEPTSGGGTRFHVSGPGLEEDLQLGLPGAHNVENALAAIAVARLLECTPEDLREGLGTFRNLSNRNEIFTLPDGITVINDSYNSNPRAMERMLETLAEWPGARRRIVVAGEMLELGKSSPELHRGVGRKCAECGVDWLIAVQGEARFFIEGAVERGMDPSRTHFSPMPRDAGEFCRSLLAPGDVVLVKGSRSVGLETVAELLCRNMSGASSEASRSGGGR